MCIGRPSEQSPPLPLLETPPPGLKPTGPGITCQVRGESQRPLFGPCPSQKKEHGIEIDSHALMASE